MPKASSITPVVMENIRHPPVQPFNPQQHFHHEQPADGYGWGQLQEDMANMSKNQTEFYDSMLAQQTAYGLHLKEMETSQQEMWQEQHQFQQEMWQEQHEFQQDVRNYQEQQREQFQSFQKEQEKMQKELTNYKKNFSSHMGKLHAAHEEQKTNMGQTHQVLQSERISRLEDHCFMGCYALGHQRDNQMHQDSKPLLQ
ncbi:hypothetical protein PIB30_084907 [Stylosanthes scabra]|uniref:Uncharacterized protein n=1 Tax=Stylosanthes scabra TaxID=79078 RepID=A0ABU6STD7_9FABA|nr:hypothetical protein [Stylosanthes scabra]